MHFLSPGCRNCRNCRTRVSDCRTLSDTVGLSAVGNVGPYRTLSEPVGTCWTIGCITTRDLLSDAVGRCRTLSDAVGRCRTLSDCRTLSGSEPWPHICHIYLRNVYRVASTPCAKRMVSRWFRGGIARFRDGFALILRWYRRVLRGFARFHTHSLALYCKVLQVYQAQSVEELSCKGILDVHLLLVCTCIANEHIV